DPSTRFGPFGAAIIDYAPVCLNVLLYRMEQDAGRIHNLLGNPKAAAEWQRRAQRRRELVDRYLWDPQAGLYFDYNFETGRRRAYPFATTFYPLWAGMASTQGCGLAIRRMKLGSAGRTPQCWSCWLD